LPTFKLVELPKKHPWHIVCVEGITTHHFSKCIKQFDLHVGAKISLLTSAAVITASCHESFYGKFRTYLKNARNLPPKGKKRKTEDELPNNKKPKLPPPTERITDLKVLKELRGVALEAQMKAWGVSKRTDKVAEKRERLLIAVKAWLEEQKD